MMERAMIILVQPVDTDDVEGAVGAVVENPDQLKRRWDEYNSLQKILVELGFHPWSRSDGTIYFSAEGCGWEAPMHGRVYDITTENILLLMEKAEERAALRDQALAKLTPEEQRVLGILSHDEQFESGGY